MPKPKDEPPATPAAPAAPQPPQCVAGCQWFRASIRGRVAGLCHRYPVPAPIHSRGHWCGEFIPAEAYARAKARSAAEREKEQAARNAATK